MPITVRQAGLQLIATAATKLEIYTASGGTKLLEFPTTEAVTANAITITSTVQNALATGTPTYARLVDSADMLLLDGDVAATGTPWITLGPVTSGRSYEISPNVSITNA